MFPRNTVLAAIAIGLALSLAGCGKIYSYKYKITVAVRDHGEIRSASNVVLVKEASGLDHNPARPVLYGEATPIQLKNGTVVFALLNGLPRAPVPGQFQWRTSPTWVLLHRFGLPTSWSNGDDRGLLNLPKIREQVKLQVYELPEFVSFGDTNDPKTIIQVDPNDPESTLGREVKFESVILEVTDEDVTRGRLKSILPWLRERRSYLDGSSLGEAVNGYQSAQFSNSTWF